ncbi:SymE family type I addiction module toxin [Pectobacterium cacticida]|uniref:SymE family type I addiction module toxin n=1 Tax=Pectobacterium cacticida TaxID=69221 RepID=UPI002FF292C3
MTTPEGRLCQSPSCRPHDMTRYYRRSPSLHLKGHWLEAAGFATDTPVVITVEQGQLVIRIVAE